MSRIIHRGRVIDEQGQPLYQAHIITTNSTPRKFTVSDQNGNFEVVGDLHETFEITHIGFKARIFRLDRFMRDTTYRLYEDVNELEGVVVTPRNPVPQQPAPKRDNSWLGDIFGTIGGIFGNGGQVMNTPPFRPTEIKIPTNVGPIYNPTAIPGNSQQPGNQYVPPINNGSSINDWISENPLASGGLLIAAIVGGAMLLKKKDATEVPV